MREWFRLEVLMPEHPKIAGLSDVAFRFYVSAIAYASRHMTDGFVPGEVHLVNGSTASARAELDFAGLIDLLPSGSFHVHDFLDYQQSKADRIALAEARSEAGKKGGKASGQARSKQIVAEPLKQTRSKNEAESESEKNLGTNGSSSLNGDLTTTVVAVSEETPTAQAAGSSEQDLRAVYAYWRDKRGKTRANYERIAPERRRKIAARLREFSAADLRRAIDGVCADPWDDRARHDDITVIFRSREQVEKFLDIADAPPAGGLMDSAAIAARYLKENQ